MAGRIGKRATHILEYIIYFFDEVQSIYFLPFTPNLFDFSIINDSTSYYKYDAIVLLVIFLFPLLIYV